MASSSQALKKAVSRHRLRQKQRGVVRMELQVPKADMESLKMIARELRNTAGENTKLRQQIEAWANHTAGTPDFKAFLLTAPLEDLDLDRASDLGREIDL